MPSQFPAPVANLRATAPLGSEVVHAILFPGALGDFICAVPMLGVLARSHALRVFARSAALEALALVNVGAAIEGRSLDGRGIAALFAASPGDGIEAACLDEEARRALGLDVGLVTSFTGAGNAEFEARVARLWPGAKILPFPKPTGNRHASDRFLRAATGDPHARASLPVLQIPESSAFRGCTPAGPASARLVFHPGSGGVGKRAAKEVFATVSAIWRDRTGGSVRCLLGPAEAGEDDLWRSIADEIYRPSDVVDLAHALSEAALFVGNDAGPSHVAAGLGVATLVLYVRTSPHCYGPRGARVHSHRMEAPKGMSSLRALVRELAGTQVPLP